MAKATTTIRQMLNYRSDVHAYFAANQALFNRVAAFYFDVINALQLRSPMGRVYNSTAQRSDYAGESEAAGL